MPDATICGRIVFKPIKDYFLAEYTLYIYTDINGLVQDRCNSITYHSCLQSVWYTLTPSTFTQSSKGLQWLYQMLRYQVSSPGPWFNIKISSYQYRKSHCGDKTVVRSSYLHNGIYYTGKMTSLYWIRALVVTIRETCHNARKCCFCSGFHYVHVSPISNTWMLATVQSSVVNWGLGC